MSFNIRYDNPNDGINIWQNRKTYVADILRNYACDFVCMQEATMVQLNDLMALLPEYQFIARSRNSVPDVGEAVPIAFTADWNPLEIGFFWLSKTPDVPASKGFGNRLPRITTWTKFEHKTSNEKILLYNTHFDHESPKSQLKSAELLVEHITSNSFGIQNIIVAGDFNVEFGNRALNVLLNSNLGICDTATDFRKQYPRFGTFHNWTGKSTEQIDFILTSNNIKTIDFQVINDSFDDRYPSDHFPIISTLQVGS